MPSGPPEVRAAPGPTRLLLVRHAQSAGNVASDRAEAAGEERIPLSRPDRDVPLSERGRRQAAALGRWLATLPLDERPTVLLSSPYTRAVDTARAAVDAAGWSMPLRLDERLRERELGVLDGLTKRGILARHPDQAEQRRRVGKLHHRPPRGESWADVLVRVRSAADDLARDHAGERVLVVTHQVVVLLFRRVLEGLSDDELLAVDAATTVGNCSVTSYVRTGDRLTLAAFNAPVPLGEEPDVETTR